MSLTARKGLYVSYDSYISSKKSENAHDLNTIVNKQGKTEQKISDPKDRTDITQER